MVSNIYKVLGLKMRNIEACTAIGSGARRGQKRRLNAKLHDERAEAVVPYDVWAME